MHIISPYHKKEKFTFINHFWSLQKMRLFNWVFTAWALFILVLTITVIAWIFFN